MLSEKADTKLSGALQTPDLDHFFASFLNPNLTSSVTGVHKQVTSIRHPVEFVISVYLFPNTDTAEKH